MSALLAKTRALIGVAPRPKGFFATADLPSWLTRGGPLWSEHLRRDAILAEGDLVWGHVVQANNALFQRGATSAAADVLFASRLEDDPDPERLRAAARATYALRSRSPSEPLAKAVAAALADEKGGTHPVLDLPLSATRGMPMRMAAVIVYRSRREPEPLAALAMPLVVSRARDGAVVLPKAHWADDLARAMLALGAAPG